MDPDIIPLTEEDLHDLYLWVDEIPLSRPKRNIARDFSDGVCVAEAVKYYFPKLVELHNYQSAHSIQGKISNWDTLNTRVFRKLFFEVPSEEIRDITAAVPGAIERFLRALRIKIEQIQQRQQQQQRGGSAGGTPSSAGGPSASPQQQNRGSSSRGSPGAGPSSSSAAAIAAANASNQRLQQEVYELREVLSEKDHTIAQLQEAVALLTEKAAQLEELVDAKNGELRSLSRGGGMGSSSAYRGSAPSSARGVSGGGASYNRSPSGGGHRTSSGNGWRR